MENKKQIFICGVPRSGTTMLASMLATNDLCIAPPESDFYINFYKKHFSNAKSKINSELLIDYINRNYRFKQWGINCDTEIRQLNKIETINYSKVYNILIEKYGRSIEKYHEDSIYVNHTPSNLLNFSIINNLFPDSKWVYIIRDPRAVFNSVKDLDWGANSAISLSNLWLEYLCNYYSIKEGLNEKITMVKYEDLLINPEIELKRICDFVNIPYHNSMINGNGFDVPNYSKKQHNLVGKPIQIDRINKWKDTLSTKDIELIEAKCGLLLKNLSYDFYGKECGLYKIKIRDIYYSYLTEVFYSGINKIKKHVRSKSK